MTTAADSITWASYGQILRRRLRADAIEEAQLEAWLALAVEEADRYIDRDFTAAPEAPEWIPGYGRRCGDSAFEKDIHPGTSRPFLRSAVDL